jgi:surface protein
MARVFEHCVSLEKLDVSNFDTDRAGSMVYVFAQCESLKALDISSFDTGNVSEFYGMFQNCKSLESLDVSSMDTSNAKSLRSVFNCCTSLKSLDLSQWNTESVEYFSDMFKWCSSLKNLDLSTFDTSNGTFFDGMFYHCGSLKNLDISSFDTGKALDFGAMFAGCKSMKYLDLYHMSAKNVKNMDWMFKDCTSLRAVDLRGFDLEWISADDMFAGCSMLMEIKLPVEGRIFAELPRDSKGAAWRGAAGTEIYRTNYLFNQKLTRKFNVVGLFKDVYNKQWYTEYVQYVFDKDLMSGSGGRFDPDGKMTRAMVVQTLYNMEGQPAVTEYLACERLRDVRQDWFTDAVCWAYNEGIATGYDDTMTFKVDQSVTREQLATFLYRYVEAKGFERSQTDDLSGLKNAWKVSDYAKAAVQWAVGAGIISGIEIYKDGKVIEKDLAPQGTATRAQMAAILQRFYELYGDRQSPVLGIPEDAFEWNGHFYAIFDNRQSWEAAKAYCESRGGHLATITSEEENQMLYAFMKERGYTSAYVGLSDKEEEGEWKWVTGEEAVYSNWNELEPGGGESENYAMFFYIYEDGTWNDGGFSDRIYDGGNAYICEWE